MPVVRAAGSNESLAVVKKRLTELLVKELLGERRGAAPVIAGPVIFEIPAPQTKSIDVIVVWEAWKDLPAEDRSSIIRGAYAQFKQVLDRTLHESDPEGPTGSLVFLPTGIVIGATWKDVEELNLLPYALVPRAKPEDADDRTIVSALMTNAGAIQTPSGIQLLFPTPELAEEVKARLDKAMPEAGWTVMERAPVDVWWDH